MELFIIAAVLIILFNLFNAIGKQANKKQPPVPGREKPASIGQAILMERHQRERPERRFRYAEPEPQRETSGEALRQEPATKRAAGAVIATLKQAEAKTSVRPSGAAHGLTNMLQNQDQLVAAFMFHEIMSPPLSKRKQQ